MTKCFSLMFLFFSSMGAKGGGPGDDMKAYRLLPAAGLLLYWGSELFPHCRLECPLTTLAYVSALTAGYISLLYRRHVDRASFKGTPDG